jgi:hypothetical protein
MKNIKYFIILLLLPCALSGQIIHPDTLVINKGENFIVLEGKVLEYKFSKPNDFKNESFGNFIKINALTDNDGLLLICLENNKNHLIYLKQGEAPIFHDTRGQVKSYADIYPLEKKLAYHYNKYVRYHSSAAVNKLKKAVDKAEASSVASINKKSKLSLILSNYERDWQMKYYSLILVNRNDHEFTPGLISIIKNGEHTKSCVMPLVITKLPKLEGKAHCSFAFAFKKNEKFDMTVIVKDKFNPSCSVELFIDQTKLK